MKEILNELEESLYKHHNIGTPFNHRTKRGMIKEWIVHNNTLKREQTNVDNNIK